MNECPPDDVLLDWAEGRASTPDAIHLAACAACRAAVAELEALLDEAGRERPLPGPAAEARVFEAIRRECERRQHARRYPTRALRWAAAATVLIAATVTGLVGVRRLKAEAVVATVVATDGRVLVRRDGVDRAALAGMALHESDQVAVPTDASAILELPDASRAELGPETTLTLHDADGEAPLELTGGFLAIDAARRSAGHPLTIRTPDARAEVVGTRFTLGADSEETHLRVAEGLVHLVRIDDGASVDVAGGHRAEVADGDRDRLESQPSLPGTALLIASYDQAPAEFERFNRLVGDRLLGRRLRHLGFRVETKGHRDVAAADLAGRPLVIVSYSQENVGFEASLERIGLRDAGVPVLCFEPVVFPTLGMTGDRRGLDYDWQGGATAVEFVNPAHPLSGGLGESRADLFDNPGCFGWARPGPSATRIATLAGDRSRAVEFAYEAGSDMVGMRAPRRRVGLFLDPSQVGEDSEAAWSLVEAAVEWCVEPPSRAKGGGR